QIYHSLNKLQQAHVSDDIIKGMRQLIRFLLSCSETFDLCERTLQGFWETGQQSNSWRQVVRRTGQSGVA
ncbi:hypothetical protein AMECASPLE_037517, partial [Ameca splendens]